MDREVHWYVGRTRSCQERKSAEALARLGIESYIPIQKVRRKWSDRVKVVDQLLLPHIVFVRCTEQKRKEMLEAVYGLVGYMMDRGSTGRRALIVPDSQMDDFKFVINGMNGVAEVEITGGRIRQGDTVEFINGPMRGFRCECVELHGKKNIVVRLGLLGSAVVEVDAKDLSPVKPEELNTTEQ